MTDEPYRWLEAIANRREYIRDQLKGATPVFAVSRPEGVLLFGIGSGQSKIFEIYDRLGLAALGNPVDIEKMRQTAIEAAHLEGFTRDPEDVTAQRLIRFSLSPILKSSFEQIFAAPLLVESILAEVGADPSGDSLNRIAYDGTTRFAPAGIAIAHTLTSDETAASEWLAHQLPAELSLNEVVRRLLAAWKTLTSGKSFEPPNPSDLPMSVPDGKSVEMALLDRNPRLRSRFRALDASRLP